MNPPPRTPLIGRAAFRRAVGDSIVGAAVEGRRELIWVDTDFAEWPLDDALLLDAMTRWARQPTRRLLIVAQTFQDVPRRHPRFTNWRRTYGHRIECRSAPDVSINDFPTLMLAADLYSLRLLDKQLWRGQWLDAETDHKSWRGVVDAIVQRSDVDFGANTLGL